MENQKGEILFYQREDGSAQIDVRLEEDTVWLTQQLMAELFNTSKQNISLHIQNIFEEGELIPDSTVKKFLTVQKEGTRGVRRQLDYYNLDMIISVGYRIKSSIATRFTEPLTQEMIKTFHRILKADTSDSNKDWFAIGDYKKLPNEVGGNATSLPENVEQEMTALLVDYHQKQTKTFRDLVDFHWRFETIHPFQDGNGRIGRLLLFKECLANNIVPFIITEQLRWFYYRGLQNWQQTEGFLLDTCLTAQDEYKAVMAYFRIC